LLVPDGFLLNGVSNAMLDWSWESFWKEGPKNYKEMLERTYDDRWVPFAAFMDTPTLQKSEGFRAKAPRAQP
jgi:hypothetical protein